MQKLKTRRFLGVFLKPPKSALPFSPNWCHDGGCPGAPPPPHRLTEPALRRPVTGGGGGRALGGANRALGGGGARSRSRIAGSGGRASLRPAATGRVADGAGPMKTTGHVKTESTEGWCSRVTPTKMAWRTHPALRAKKTRAQLRRWLLAAAASAWATREEPATGPSETKWRRLTLARTGGVGAPPPEVFRR